MSWDPGQGLKIKVFFILRQLQASTVWWNEVISQGCGGNLLSLIRMADLPLLPTRPVPDPNLNEKYQPDPKPNPLRFRWTVQHFVLSCSHQPPTICNLAAYGHFYSKHAFRNFIDYHFIIHHINICSSSEYPNPLTII